MAATYHNLLAGPFTQDWSNTGLITTNDDWSGVSSIDGFLGNNDSASPTGVDPQTVVAFGTGAIDVIANQTNPNITNGGVAEFELANPVVALQGSGTADSPFLLLYLDTTGVGNTNVSFNLRDIDGSADNAIQAIAVQYRIGNSGDFINLSPGFVADATTGPSLATQVTPVSVTLPDATNNQAQVQVRIITTNAVGNDEWVGIDDINISGTPLDNPNPGITVTQTNGITEVNEEGETTDTYAIALNTTPTSPVTIQVAADAQTRISSDGVNFFDTITLNLSSTAAQTITVKAVNDTNVEGSPHTGTITHTVSSSDPNYSSLTVPNINVSILDNEVSVTKIHTIQGSGTTATAGTFTIEGVVVGDFQETNQLNGFYIQEEDADADGSNLTSEGIFVNSLAPVTFGDKVRITGTISELAGTPDFGQAQLTPTNTATVTVLASGQNGLVTPTFVNLPAATETELERYEGMLVTFQDQLTVTEHFQLGRFGQITLSSAGILRTPTDIIDPNDIPASGTSSSGTSNVAAVTAQQTANNLASIVLDDASNSSFRFPTPYINRTPGEPATLRIGSTIDNLTGILGFGFNEYRVQRNPYDASDPLNQSYPLTINYSDRPDVPQVGGNVQVASFNVLNYFTTLNDGANGARGANSAAEFERQKAKTVAALAELDADVVGLIEVQNNGTTAISDLVNALNAEVGANTYAFINDPAGYTSNPGGTDAIKVAFIYKPSVVTPVGNALAPNDPAFNLARAPVAQTFRTNATGEIFTPIINHFKSKASSAGLPGDTDQGDGQGLSNASRKAQATALLNFVNNTVIPQSGDGDVMLLGDFNAYSEEDPIDILRAGGFTKLNTTTGYIFDGQAGSLDHALVNSSLLSQVSGADKWNINAYEPNALDYNDNVVDPGESSSNPPRNDPSLYQPDPFRSSDHDPVLVGLNLQTANTNPIANNDAATVVEGSSVAIDVLANDTDANSDTLTIASFTNPASGTLAQNNDGTLTYSAALDSASSDSFTYTVSDGKGGTSTATVALTIDPLNLQGNDSANTLIGTSRDNRIDGNGDNDVLIGAAGNDTLTGGSDRGSITLGSTAQTSTLGRASNYSNNASGVAAFRAEWLNAAAAQDVDLTGTSLNANSVNYTPANAPTTLSNSSTSYGNTQGIGVQGAYSGWTGSVAAEIHHNPNATPNLRQSEELTVKWAETVSEAFVDLSLFFAPLQEKFGREVGSVRAFRNGVEVDITGTRMRTETAATLIQASVNNSALGTRFTADSLTGSGDYKLKLVGSFDELRFSANPYTDATIAYRNRNSKPDSSDYLIQQIKYNVTEPAVSDLVVGDAIATGTGDDLINFSRGSGVDLVTDFEAGSDKVVVQGYSESDLILLGSTAAFRNGDAYEAITSTGSATYTSPTNPQAALTGNGYIWQRSDFVFA